MGFGRSLLMLFPLAMLAFQQPSSSQQAEQPSPDNSYSVTVNRVVLDVIVTDKKGKVVKDLRPEDVEVYEDGVLQKLASLRLVEEVRAESPTPSSPGTLEGQKPAASPTKPSLNLITLVFDRISLYGRKMAKESATKYVAELGAYDVASVMVIDRTLRVLCPYTRDTNTLQAAVELATDGTSQQFAQMSERIQQAVNNAEGAAAKASAGTAAAGRYTGGPGAETFAAYAEANMEEVVADMLRHAYVSEESIQGHSTVDALKTIVRGLRVLPGRKAVVFFAERIALPMQVQARFKDLISMANRENVSFYCLDTKGLEEQLQLEPMRDELGRLSGVSRTQVRKQTGEVTREEVFLAENVNNAITMSDQNSLAHLAEGTGGLLVANANDLLPGLQKVSEDLHSHYEITYAPTNLLFNGAFRKVEVKLKRDGLSARSREGYYALPDNELAESPYEIPLYEALSAAKPAVDLPFRTASLLFPTGGPRSDVLLYVEVPLSAWTFDIGKEKKYSGSVNLMVAVKNTAGRIIEKFSQEFPLEGAAEKLEETKTRNFVFYRKADLAPGRYSVEAVIRDPKSERTSVRRAVLLVPPRAAGPLRISSIVLVKRLDEKKTNIELQANPLMIGEQMVIPYLNQPLALEDRKNLGFYFVVRGRPEEKVSLNVILHKNGQPMGQLEQQEPPPPDERGEVRYLASVPASSFEAGSYEVEVVATQGERSANSRASFQIQ